MSRRHLSVGSVAVLAAVLLAAPAAQAVPCNDPTFTDADGVTYKSDRFAQGSSINRDAFSNSGSPYFNRHSEIGYEAIPDDCTVVDGGQGLVFPAREINGITVQPKVYVPSSGPSFFRHAYLLRNVSTTQASLVLYRSTVAGSGVTPHILGTSSGDTAGTAADDWITWNNSADASDPAAVAVWQASSPQRRAAADDVYNECCTDADDPVTHGFVRMTNRYQRIVLEPGELAVLVHYFAVRAADAAGATAAELAGTPAYALAGLSAEEVSAIRNFVPPDGDGDGRASGVDNCPYAANPGQEDLDADALGDACDPDDDNDGLSDDVEVVFRTNPRLADTDGDGRGDRDDACPRTRSSLPDGCPLFDQQQTTTIGRVPPRSTVATLTPARDRTLPYRFTLRGSVLPPDGVSVAQACSAPGQVSMQVKAGGNTISARRAALRRDCSFRRTVSFANRRRTGRGRRSLQFTVRWLGNRFLEPATIRTFTRRIG